MIDPPTIHTPPDVSVLIANWNGSDVLADCLRSVYEKTADVSFEIIVVDDASVDQSVGMVRARFPDVKILVNQANLGFVRSNNRGIRMAGGRYLLLLNSDTLLANNALKILADHMDSHPDAGVCGAWLKNPDMTSQISYGDFPSLGQALVDALFLNDLFPGAGFLNRGVIPRGNPTSPREVSYVSGADLFLRKEIVDRIGLFDELYEAYCEETDLCYRIKTYERLKVHFVPEAQIVHLGGASYGKLGKRQLQMQFLSFDKFLTKYHGKIYSMVTRLFYAWHFAMKSVFRYFSFLVAGADARDSRRASFLKARYAMKYSLFPRVSTGDGDIPDTVTRKA